MTERTCTWCGTPSKRTNCGSPECRTAESVAYVRQLREARDARIAARAEKRRTAHTATPPPPTPPPPAPTPRGGEQKPTKRRTGGEVSPRRGGRKHSGIRFCSAPECVSTVTTKGLCDLHYQRQWWTGSTELKGPSECAFCGGPLVRRGTHGPLPTYCSTKCRAAAGHRRAKEAGRVRRKPTPPRVWECAQCGVSFEGRKRKYCSKRCGRLAERQNPKRWCEVPGCDRPYRARGMCGPHYNAWHHETKGRKPSVWTDARRDAAQRRRALKRDVATGGRVLRSEIARRDKYRCHLCRGKVDMKVAWPHSMSPSLDHVIPLARGGTHDPANVKLAHLGCNTKKGVRGIPDGEQLMLIG